MHEAADHPSRALPSQEILSLLSAKEGLNERILAQLEREYPPGEKLFYMKPHRGVITKMDCFVTGWQVVESVAFIVVENVGSGASHRIDVIRSIFRKQQVSG